MTMKHRIGTAALMPFVLLGDTHAAGNGQPGGQAPSRTVVYKTVGTVQLKMHVFLPPGHRAGDTRPAAVFFFGGGWTNGNPAQFFPHCAYLAGRGMVAASAEYRVRSRHGVTPYECVTDAKSAVRWLRQHATELGIDPARVAAGGGSAGGHVAACTGTVMGLDEADEDQGISSRPDAMVLFNPALVLDLQALRGSPERLRKLQARFAGRDPLVISPYHQVKPGCPPALILHGEADTTVPFATARRFAARMEEQGNRCQLVGYPGRGHGFFNFARGDDFYTTLRVVDQFLVSLGFLAGEDTVADFQKRQAGAPPHPR